METTFDLETPVITQRDRHIEAVWTLSETDGEKQQACLSVTHHGKAEYYSQPSKVYIATLTRQAKKSENGITRTSFALYSGKTILREPAPRYNVKIQRAVLDEAIRQTIELLRTDEQVQAIFAR